MSTRRIGPADYRVHPDAALDLKHIDTCADDALPPGEREAVEAETEALTKRLRDLQDLFYADGTHRLLIVFQAIDTGGKDGTIRRVFGRVNPAGVRVVPFKQPTAPELAHDYLWRVHPHVPGDGEWVLFNRSHYEDILITRVHGWVTPEEVTARQGHIRDFERMLTDTGTTIVKFLLHISNGEQKQRLQARIDEPDKNWKFSSGDLAERGLWDSYQLAFADALATTSRQHAPWYAIPADRKWQRDHIVAQIVVDAVESLDLHIPPGEPDIDKIHII